MIGIVTAAGNAKRFGGKIKQLLKIKGETLLDRTARLFGPHLDEIYLATHRGDLTHPKMKVWKPAGRRWKCETIYSTRSLWSSDVLVLHGDVYFSDRARNMIMNHNRKKTAFFWDGFNEVFAMSVPQASIPQVLERIETAIQLVSNSPTPVLDNAAGLGPLMNLFGKRVPYDRVLISDDTQDFDLPEEYEGFLNGWRKHGRAN